ncbi:MAG TPA: bifunctional nuclease family protein [Gemmatimonadales bacterium]|jgi:hypothetical protein|nr:bifunctional nuclease family protein [Gemmatimonadales bacterium]
MVVARLGIDRATGTPVVVLREAAGARGLPIWIGPSEANAIAIAMQQIAVPRPLTHDLLRHVLQGLGGELLRVAITSSRDNTFYAELLVRHGTNELAGIDARPSDAIALAVRCGAPILAAESLLQRADAPDPTAPWPLQADALRKYLEGLDPQDFGRFLP